VFVSRETASRGESQAFLGVAVACLQATTSVDTWRRMQVSTATATADGLGLESSVLARLLSLIQRLQIITSGVPPGTMSCSLSNRSTNAFPVPAAPRHSSSRQVRIDRPTDRDVQSRVVPPRGTSWLEDLRPLRLKATGGLNNQLVLVAAVFIRLFNRQAF
jgi:hypothetical protein